MTTFLEVVHSMAPMDLVKDMVMAVKSWSLVCVLCNSLLSLHGSPSFSFSSFLFSLLPRRHLFPNLTLDHCHHCVYVHCHPHVHDCVHSCKNFSFSSIFSFSCDDDDDCTCVLLPLSHSLPHSQFQSFAPLLPILYFLASSHTAIILPVTPMTLPVSSL